MKIRKDTPRVRNKKGEHEWRGRIRWIGADGRERQRQRTATSKRHAKGLADQLAAQLEAGGEIAFDAERLTFEQLAEDYKAKKLIEPVYAGATRVAGMRSWKRQRGFLKPLVAFFGRRLLQRITYEDLVAYRAQRFEGETRLKAQRSVSMVNRELSLLRGIFNYARRCGYLSRSPFEMGEGLISLADETKRDRILTPEEEQRLLDQCVGRRAHLRAIVIAAADTAMRKGELLALRWSDVDLTEGVINIRGTTTKTQQGRTTGITARLRVELEKLRKGREPDGPVFPTGDPKRAFARVCREAGIIGLHFHDLRHTGTTRIVSTGLPSALAMEITGHTQFSTFKRYVNVDQNAARQAAALLDELNRDKPAEEEPTTEELIH